MQSVFRKAGLDVKVTSTSFRKAAVTKGHIDQPDMSGKLADLMAHNQTTAKKYLPSIRKVEDISGSF